MGPWDRQAWLPPKQAYTSLPQDGSEAGCYQGRSQLQVSREGVEGGLDLEYQLCQ